MSEFILANLDPIIAEWESFAGTIVPEYDSDKLALRDHAKEILQTVAADMETSQTASEQRAKSRGRGKRTAQDTAAETHSTHRLQLGFNQTQVVSEYRALRATVIRLWIASTPELDRSGIDQLTRFNESIDQALGESTARFMGEIEKARDFASAVLAHDLRNPLQAILSAAEVLSTQEKFDSAELNTIASIIVDSGTQMSRLIGSLLDFTRTRLGQPLPLKPESTDLAHICRQAVAELRAAHPKRIIELDCPPLLRGVVDPTRIAQMLSNLTANAIHHGTESRPVSVAARREGEQIILEVHNDGPPIPPAALPTIFDAMPSATEQRAPTGNQFSNLGLGLYIVREIVEAHSGKITATSTLQAGTTFCVSLPGGRQD